MTVVTAGAGDHRTGLTVSSLVVAEGEPSRIYFLLGSTTDLFYGLEETGDERFLVMELVEGEDLAKRLERGPIDLDEALRIAVQVETERSPRIRRPDADDRPGPADRGHHVLRQHGLLWRRSLPRRRVRSDHRLRR